MEFVEIKEEEFNEISNSFDTTSFYQSTEWASIKKSNNWISYYVGIKQGKKITACSMILGKKIILNHYLYYAPRGLLLDYNNYELLKYFVKEIKKFLKLKKGIALKIDPLVTYKNHDNLGNIIDNKSNEKIIKNLEQLGFKHRGFTVGYSDEAQFRWSYCLEISKSEEEILKNMNQRCRRCLRKYQEYPLEMVEVNDSNINDFKKIMEHTAKRQNHFDRTLEYYKKIQETFKEKCKLEIIYLNKKTFLEKFKDHKLYEEISKEKEDKIGISAGLFIFEKNRANYVYGGTYKNYMPLMAQYMLQMEMINLSIKKGINLYDFGGISGDFNPESENYGVYDFKRGFGGYVVEYIGEFDLIINKIFYIMYTEMFKIYRNLKHIIAKIKKI